MIRISKLALCSVIVGALAVSVSVSQAQAQDMAKRGKKLFVDKGCNTCHTIGKGKLAGPDLAGVTQRRTTDWLKRWLKDPTALIGSDSIADAMVVEYASVKMPNMKLGDSDIAALLAYIGGGGKMKM